MAAMAENTEAESDEEIERILDERHSRNTTKSTKNALKTFSVKSTSTDVFKYRFGTELKAVRVTLTSKNNNLTVYICELNLLDFLFVNNFDHDIRK